MRIAVIILNYNSSADCRKCISFLKRQEGVELEMIVVDNCSLREGEQEAIRQLCQEQGCTFIPAETNCGYNAGNNIGLRYAAGKGYEYAMIANPDMEFPETDYMATLYAKMQDDGQIVVCGSDIVNLDGQHESPMKRDGWCWGSWGWLRPGQTPSHTDSGYCYKVSGCCLMVRISFIESLGYFDENVFLYCEESILAKQVEQARKRTYYLADRHAVHAHVKSTKGDPVKRFEAWKKSRLYFVKRYYGKYNLTGKLMERLSIHLHFLSYKLFRYVKH